MSRNPILTDKAFDPAQFGGTGVATQPSPAEEWEQAQRGGATTATADQALRWASPRARPSPGLRRRPRARS